MPLEAVAPGIFLLATGRAGVPLLELTMQLVHCCPLMKSWNGLGGSKIFHHTGQQVVTLTQPCSVVWMMWNSNLIPAKPPFFPEVSQWKHPRLHSNYFSKICDLFSALKVENTEVSITRKFFQMDHVSWRIWPLQLINVSSYRPLILSVFLTRVILTSVLYIAVRLAEFLMANRHPDLEKKWSRSLVSMCSWFS